MSLAYVNIGSNIGKREQLIAQALEKISECFGICCVSSIIETEPWGYESGNRFLNLGVSFRLAEPDPEMLLTKLQEIEKAISKVDHRDIEGNYKDREIDIDIMAIDDLRYESERLIIPHKHLLDRKFFLEPLKELNNNWKYPG